MNVNLPVGRRAEIFCDDPSELLRFYNDVLINQEYKDVPPGPHKVVVDLGANLGMFSLWIYDSAETVYAVEASDANYRNLRKTIEANGLTKIKAFHLAIAGESGTRVLVSKGDCGGYNIMNDRAPGSSIETVDAVTLKGFLDANDIDRVDILKIDVEGAEREIFATPEFAEIVPRLPFIVGECHADYGGQSIIIDSIGELCSEVIALRRLQELGYRVTCNPVASAGALIFVARLSS